MKIAHIINIFNCKEDHPSYLYYAQPITFESMRLAKEEAAKHSIEVELCSTHYPEDDKILPPYFTKLPYLKRDTKKVFPKLAGKKKLPFIQDILNMAYEYTDAEYVVFTSSDIGLQKNFYTEVANIIKRKKVTSLMITRRDNLPAFDGEKRLTPKDMDFFYKQKGEKHPGKETFIMRREYIPRIKLADVFQGYPPWGTILNTRLRDVSKLHRCFYDKSLSFHIGKDSDWMSLNDGMRKKNTILASEVKTNAQIENLKEDVEYLKNIIKQIQDNKNPPNETGGK